MGQNESDSIPERNSQFALGSVLQTDAPDYLLIRELNKGGMYSFAQEVALRRRSEFAPVVAPSGNQGAGAPASFDSSAYAEQNARAHWSMLWMESIAEEGVANYPSQPDDVDLLKSVLKQIEEFAQQENTSPRYVWILHKSAWCRWLLCRSMVAAYLANPTRTAVRESALNEIRIGLEQLEQVNRLATEIPIKTTTDSYAPSSNELVALAIETNLLNCDYLVLRANLYRDEPDERIACGTQMLRHLEDVDKKLSLEFRGRAQVDLARARAWFYSNQLSKVTEIANEYLGSQATKQSPFVTQTSLAAIASEASRTLNQFDLAEHWIHLAGGWESAPQLALESLALDLATLDFDDNTQLKAILSKKETIASRFGPYWGQRADAILVSNKKNIHPDLASGGTLTDGMASNQPSPQPSSTSGGTSSPPNSSPLTAPTPNVAALTILRAEAKQLLAAKQFDRAIEKLRQAEQVANQLNLFEDAMNFRIQVAALYGMQKLYLQSASEFHSAALTYTKSNMAAKAAINAIAMIQQRLQELEKPIANASGNENSDAQNRKGSAQEALDLRTDVWKTILENWPTSDQGDSAAKSLSAYYLSTDQVWSYAELWCSLWERTKQSGEASTANSGSETRIPFSEAYSKRVSAEAVQAFRVLCFLKNQNWTDSNLLGSSPDERWANLKNRLEELAIGERNLTEELKASVAISNGYGWEYKSDSDIDLGATSCLRVWVDCHILLDRLMRASGNSDELRDLQQLLALWKTLPRIGPTGDSHLAATLDRAHKMVSIFAQSKMENPTLAIEQLKELEQQNPNDPWWGFYAARILETIPGQEEKALQRYVKLGNSLPAGGEGWLECRTRSVHVLSKLGRKEAAEKLVNMVIALQSNIPAVWKNRLHAALQ